MPLYDFRCSDCSATRKVMEDFERSGDLELVCMACGGAMHVAPVLSISVLGRAVKDSPGSSSSLTGPKPCGHNHSCRCSIRLDRPNPFANDIRKANGLSVDT